MEQGTGNREQGTGKGEVDALWAIFIEELSPKKPHPKLTTERREKLVALYDEQLKRSDDPHALFRKVLTTVKESDFHMRNRRYQMPESLFLNANRRDRWVMEAMSAGPNTSWAEEEAARWRALAAESP